MHCMDTMMEKTMNRPTIKNTQPVVYDSDYADEHTNGNSNRVVSPDFKRDLKQFEGLDQVIEIDGKSDEEIFSQVMEQVDKVLSYDGYPTYPFGNYVGKTFRFAGCMFTSKHTFSSAKVQDEFGNGVTMRGYDTLLLKVTHVMNAKGNMEPIQQDGLPFQILATSATQPILICEQVLKFCAPGDWPATKDLTIYKSGNAQKLGPLQK